MRILVDELVPELLLFGSLRFISKVKPFLILRSGVKAILKQIGDKRRGL